jgi:hypothetical protein
MHHRQLRPLLDDLRSAQPDDPSHCARQVWIPKNRAVGNFPGWSRELVTNAGKVIGVRVLLIKLHGEQRGELAIPDYLGRLRLSSYRSA